MNRTVALRRSIRALIPLATLAVATSVVGCGGTASIANHWVHSHEEDAGESMMYRPSTHEFPPSRGREGWEFRADGSAVHHAIAPADGNERHAGTWSLSEENILTIVLRSGTPTRYVYRVERLKPDELVLRRAD